MCKIHKEEADEGQAGGSCSGASVQQELDRLAEVALMNLEVIISY